MEEVHECKVEEILEPEQGEGGEESLANPNHGQANDAAHQECEQGPVVEQGRVLPECKQVSPVPVKLFLKNLSIRSINHKEPDPKLNNSRVVLADFAYLPNMAIVPPGHMSTK